MIAVIIPVYNRIDVFKQALRSLENQTYKSFITVICDDCSTEDIRSAMKDIQLKFVYLRSETNKGPGEARNMGLRWADNNNIEAVMFLDSDDMLMPHAVSALATELRHTHASIISSPITYETKEGLHGCIEGNMIKTWLHGKMYRMSYLKANHISFTSLRSNEDLCFNLCAFENVTEKTSVYIDNNLYLWRYDTRSITRAPSETRDNCSGADFIEAVYQYMIWFRSFADPKTANYQTLFSQIMMCYNYTMLALEKGLLKEKHEQMLYQMINADEFKDYFKQYWKKLSPDLFRQYHTDGNEIRFFSLTVGEWLKKWGNFDMSIFMK